MGTMYIIKKVSEHAISLR